MVGGERIGRLPSDGRGHISWLRGHSSIPLRCRRLCRQSCSISWFSWFGSYASVVGSICAWSTTDAGHRLLELALLLGPSGKLPSGPYATSRTFSSRTFSQGQEEEEEP